MRLEDLAEHWKRSGFTDEDARGRLKNMLETAARFDALDRSALAFLLVSLAKKTHA